jgi:iron-sulfur cluster assembly protein
MEGGCMISITPVAAEKIRKAAAESGVEPPVLRLAAQRTADGSLDYGMGFDQSRPGDATVEVEGIVVVVAAQSRELVEGTRVDFVELEPGDFRFIFVAPGEPEGE